MSRWPAAVWALAVAASMLGGCRNDGSEGAAGPATSSANLPPGAVPSPSAQPTLALPPVAAPPTAVPSMAGLPSFADLVAEAKPAVVTVRAWVRKRNALGRQVSEPAGVGTGFVYDENGYLLTNNHVIEEAHEVIVTFADDREMPAQVVGADKPTDVAVLKVEATGLHALALGDSKALRVGDWVVAIGNPFGLSYTVSKGILSAKGRTRDDVKGLDPSGYFNFLQTDASINPGNSGGPLLNLAGQVVGINAAVRANANNIGFAIPMDMVVQLLPMLLKEGRIRRSAIGIVVDEVSQADADRLKRAREGGKVVRVVAGKAGDKAGLAVGDITLAFDSKPVKDQNELRWLASIAGIARTVPIQVARGDRIFDLRITLGELTEP